MGNVVRGQVNHTKEFRVHLENRKKPETHRGDGSMQDNDKIK